LIAFALQPFRRDGSVIIRIVQAEALAASIARVFGTAWGKSEYTAFLTEILIELA